MNKSDSIAKLAEALSKAQAKMGAAQMTATNPFLHNRYADLGEVIKAAKQPMVDNGLSYSQLVVSEGDRVGVTTVLMHASGEWLESTVTLPLGEEKGKSLAQVAGSVITYLRRYSLASALGIYADEDDDANEKPTQKAAPKPQAQPVKPPTPAEPPAPVEPPAAKPAHDYAWAAELKTPKGKRLGDLPTDDLKKLIAFIQGKAEQNGGLTEMENDLVSGANFVIAHNEQH